ncbi:sensor histidine kinase [Spirosoma radiotolerans]|uniref:sensor histidine kinase n=1 Tax=Spirosoma radiotolerans TaxID=1379870 RepID=UPI000696EBAC|nr:histidine kinase [Spirosoma radiotolerans]
MIHNFYLGAVSTIVLLNAVQWSFSRDWVHGLFTLHPLIWLLLALMQGLPLTEPYFLASHTGGDGLALLIYVEIIHRMFDQKQYHRRVERWFRWVQLSILTYMVIEVGLLLIIPERWLSTLIYPYASLLYWSTLTGCCLVGFGIASRHQNPIGWFFMIGSFLLMLNEAQSVYYFFTRLFMHGPAALSRDTMLLIQQIIIGGFILKLLCFSLCLVFWQRKMAVARAVAQARTKDRLEQERLQAQLSQQRLEQENTDMQLRALQAQVNPHFLFNSLNSLSSLIDDEPERAGQFVNELSVVYRYLLRANQIAEPRSDGQRTNPDAGAHQLLTTLANELAFIESYYHLLKTRYGDGLYLTVHVSDTYQHYLLPSLTLQLLVENAVKHNSTSSKHPLTVEITVDAGGYLTVRNNLQRKKARVLSNGVGLSTIAAQYQKLKQPVPEVSEERDWFIVCLRLIVPPSDVTVSAELNGLAE